MVSAIATQPTVLPSAPPRRPQPCLPSAPSPLHSYLPFRTTQSPTLPLPFSITQAPSPLPPLRLVPAPSDPTLTACCHCNHRITDMSSRLCIADASPLAWLTPANPAATCRGRPPRQHRRHVCPPAHCSPHPGHRQARRRQERGVLARTLRSQCVWCNPVCLVWTQSGPGLPCPSPGSNPHSVYPGAGCDSCVTTAASRTV